jgi:hypothetical protein
VRRAKADWQTTVNGGEMSKRTASVELAGEPHATRDVPHLAARRVFIPVRALQAMKGVK